MVCREHQLRDLEKDKMLSPELVSPHSSPPLCAGMTHVNSM